jgi:predicted PurR-regulated permease PerM
MNTKVEVSPRTIIFLILLVLGIWLIFQIKDILLLLFISFILMSSLNPLVDRLEKHRLPRALAILIIYLIGILLVVLVGTIIMPPLVTESIYLLSRLPSSVNALFPSNQINLDTIFQQIIPVGGGVIKLSIGVFTNFITLVTLLVFTFYFLLERKKMQDYLVTFIGIEAGKKIFTIVSDIENKLGGWVRGELILMTIIGIESFIGLTLLRVDYALPLAIFAGLLEIVPIIGPIISAVPAVLVAFGTSPILALIVVGLYILIQQTENNLIVPSVMKKAVGLSPIVTILALMIGGRLAGTPGAILSVPTVLIIQIIITNLIQTKQS